VRSVTELGELDDQVFEPMLHIMLCHPDEKGTKVPALELEPSRHLASCSLSLLFLVFELGQCSPQHSHVVVSVHREVTKAVVLDEVLDPLIKGLQLEIKEDQLVIEEQCNRSAVLILERKANCVALIVARIHSLLLCKLLKDDSLHLELLWRPLIEVVQRSGLTMWTRQRMEFADTRKRTSESITW